MLWWICSYAPKANPRCLLLHNMLLLLQSTIMSHSLLFSSQWRSLLSSSQAQHLHMFQSLGLRQPRKATDLKKVWFIFLIWIFYLYTCISIILVLMFMMCGEFFIHSSDHPLHVFFFFFFTAAIVTWSASGFIFWTIVVYGYLLKYVFMLELLCLNFLF